MRGLAAAAAVAAALATAPAAAAGPFVDRAVAAFVAHDRVYVDAGARPTLTREQADRVEGIANEVEGPLVLTAVLPAVARGETGGSSRGVAVEIGRRLDCRCTIAVLVGGRLRAASSILGRDKLDRIATRAFEQERRNGIDQVLVSFIKRVDDEQTRTTGGGATGTALGVAATLALAGGILWLVRRRRRHWRELTEVRAAAHDDLAALADNVRALEAAVERPGAPPEARDEYRGALALHERAQRRLALARRPRDLAAVAEEVGEGRRLTASARARLEGRPVPERRPPCFFDPRHGPSTREVEWAPPRGAPRPVPACEADALRVEEGLEPATRQLEIGGARVPYWNAPAYYGPWFGGYFGPFGGAGGLLGEPPGAPAGGAGDSQAAPQGDAGWDAAGAGER